MPAPTNQIKAMMQRGEVAYGCWMGLAQANVAEILGTAGFDWLAVDNEHSPNDLRSTRDALIALDATGTPSVVRVPVGEVWMVKQMLDVGAQTLVIPMVESAEHAAQMVAACRYPPKGVRGVGYSMTRSSRFSGIPDYGQTADEQICLFVQVESQKGMDALDDILAVDGLDGVFIGPADLAADMGYMGQLKHPDVVAAILDAIHRIKAAGKFPGFLSSDEEMLEQAIGAGAQFVAVGLDVLMLATAARTLAKRWKD